MKTQKKIPELNPDIVIKKSVCAICDPQTQCGLSLYVQDGKIIKVEGDENQPYGQGTLCPKGAATRQYVYNPDRIKTPLKRVGERGSGEFVPISWEEAYEEIARNFLPLKEAGRPEEVAFFSGYTKIFRPWLKRLTHSFGSPNYLSESSSCAKGMLMGQKLVYGCGAGPDFGGGIGCLLIWSSNPFYSNPGKTRTILKALEGGTKLIVVDSRDTPTTKRAHIHLKPRHGTDGALALSMAYVMITEGLLDDDFIRDYTYGFEAYKEYVLTFPPSRGEELTGVPAALIEEAARLFATATTGAIMPSAAPIAHNTNGVQNHRAIFSLLGLTGNYGVAGGQMPGGMSFAEMDGRFPTKQGPFMQSRPASEMKPMIGAEAFPAWNEVIASEGQAMYLPQQIRTEKPYPIRAVLGMGMNYRMWPDSEGMAEALKKLDFFVDVDLFLTDTAKLADIVLPACTSVERSEVRCWPNGYVTCTKPAIEPLYDSRSDMDILCQLATYLVPEDKLLCSGVEATTDWILEPSGLTVAKLQQYPSGMFVENPQFPAPKAYEEKGFATPSGKLEFYSQVLAKYQREGYDPLPVYTPPKYSYENTPEMAKEYPLVLSTGCRLPMLVHTRTYRLPWSASLCPNIPIVELHPEDGDIYGLAQGEKVWLATPANRVSVRVSLTRMAHRGTAYLYHGNSVADANSLIPWDYQDPLSGYPGYKALLCRIEKEG